MLKYARIHTFYKLLKPYQERARRARMADFVRIMQPKPSMRILDIGGTPEIWRYVSVPLHITLVNLEHPTQEPPASTQHNFTFVIANASLPLNFEESHDIVFSNSVIEHVGDAARQRGFADNILRSGSSYWVQTPAKWFPVEAHTGMPFWWFYPERLRQRFISSWKQKLPAWTEMIDGTRLVELENLQSLFPDAHIHVEKSLGIVKSYTAYQNKPK